MLQSSINIFDFLKAKSYNLKAHNAFTLIEMIIVITIIGILVAIVASQYASFTRKARLDALIDDIVTEIKDAKDKTVSGYNSGKTDGSFGPYKCFGIAFNRGGNKDSIFLFAGQYKEDEANPCRFEDNDNGKISEYKFTKGFQVNKIHYEKQDSFCEQELIVFYIPPEGKFGAVCRGQNFLLNNGDVVKIEIGTSNSPLSSAYVDRIDVDYPTGKINIIHE